MSAPTTLLALASYHKGAEFLRECKRLGARVLLLTTEALRGAEWPRESIDEVLVMPDLHERDHVVRGVSYLARTERLARIVPLDEFDLEIAALLREHLRVPGMGESAVRHFRDKLAMRMRAAEAGIAVPEFVPIVHHADVREFLRRVPPPWVLKPRLSASAMGIRKVDDPDAVWRHIDGLGDRQSYHLLERFVPGDVYHVDAIVWDGAVRFAEASGYLHPPFDIYHGGGVFCTRTLDSDVPVSRALAVANHEVTAALGMRRGVLHTEFIVGAADGRVYFLETAARVGGAHIVEMLEAATGINLWREWARIEVADARGERYAPPVARRDAAGLLVSLARQEWPDLSGYTDPEVVWRLAKRYHAGLIVAARDTGRVHALLQSYMPRFQREFAATLPATETAIE